MATPSVWCRRPAARGSIAAKVTGRRSAPGTFASQRRFKGTDILVSMDSQLDGCAVDQKTIEVPLDRDVRDELLRDRVEPQRDERAFRHISQETD